MIKHSPAHLWFAWRPVWTLDGGYRWFTHVYRHRVWTSTVGRPIGSFWSYAKDSR